MAKEISFVTAAPGKLILAGEHSVVHHTRALATVIDKRTFAHFRFVPAATATPPDHDDDKFKVELEIDFKTRTLKFEWTYKQIKDAIRDVQLPSTLPALFESLPSLQSSFTSLPSHSDPIAQVFLLYYASLSPFMVDSLRGDLFVRVESELPMSAGLGSSASFTTTLSAGFIWLGIKLLRQQPEDSRAHGNIFGMGCGCEWKETEYFIPRSGDASTGSSSSPAAATASVAATAEDATATPVSPSSDSSSPSIVPASPPPATSSSTSSSIPTFQPCSHLKELMNSWSFEGEKVIHGNPSGVDNACAVYGGVIVYRRGSPLRFLSAMPPLQLLVVHTRQSRDTKKLVAGVGELKDQFPQVMQAVFEAVENIVAEWLKLIENEADKHVTDSNSNSSKIDSSNKSLTPQEIESRISSLMRLNQGLLQTMGVGHPRIDAVLRCAEEHGFVGGKLTGAGGGGCVIILQPTLPYDTDSATRTDAADRFSRFKTTLKEELGCDFLETVVGQAGVWIRDGKNLNDIAELRQHKQQ